MGNRHGSMGVTINYDADLQASVETASVDKAMDIEADLKDKLQSKIKENEDVEATVTVDLDYYDKVDEVATFNVNIQLQKSKMLSKKTWNRALMFLSSIFLKLPSRIIITRRKKFTLLPKRSVNS